MVVSLGLAIKVLPSANTICCRGAFDLNTANTAAKLTFLSFLTFLGGLGGLAHEHPDGGGVGMMVGMLNIRYISIFSDPCRLFSIQKLNNLIRKAVLCLLGFATELSLNPHRILNINLTKRGVSSRVRSF